VAKGNFAGVAMFVVEGAVVVGTGKIDVLFQEIVVVVVEIVDLKVVD
jgi:hypothetical protein